MIAPRAIRAAPEPLHDDAVDAATLVARILLDEERNSRSVARILAW